MPQQGGERSNVQKREEKEGTEKEAEARFS
jgi:hypothetical protein